MEAAFEEHCFILILRLPQLQFLENAVGLVRIVYIRKFSPTTFFDHEIGPIAFHLGHVSLDPAFEHVVLSQSQLWSRR